MITGLRVRHLSQNITLKMVLYVLIHQVSSKFALKWLKIYHFLFQKFSFFYVHLNVFNHYVNEDVRISVISIIKTKHERNKKSTNQHMWIISDHFSLVTWWQLWNFNQVSISKTNRIADSVLPTDLFKYPFLECQILCNSKNQQYKGSNLQSPAYLVQQITEAML